MVAAMISSLLALAMSLPIVNANALPAPHKPGKDVDHKTWTWDWTGPVWLRRDLAQYQPTTASLPPNSNVTLARVVLGLGVQNYTCENVTSTPKAAGALATLFDTTWLFQFDKSSIDTIAMKYLHAYEAKSCTKFGQTDVTDDCCEDEVNESLYHLRTAGHHYFQSRNGKGVPFFDLSTSRKQERLSAMVIASVKAPADASSVGANGVPAVNWLFLTDDKSGQSAGLSEVYRVKTAGGAATADACKSGQKTLGVKYAAQYWFYE